MSGTMNEIRRNSGKVMTRVGGVALLGGWIVAIFARNVRAAAVVVMVAGLALIFLGDRIARDTRRRRISDRSAEAAPLPSAHMKGSYVVALIETDGSRRRDGLFEVTADGFGLLLGADLVKAGADEWQLRVSRRRGRASISSGGEVVAKGDRVSKEPSRWVISGGLQEYSISIGGERTAERMKSAFPRFGRDTVTVDRHNAVVSLPAGGPPVATIDLTYTVVSKLRKFAGSRAFEGSFAGGIEVRSPAPIPVVVLGLRLALGPWAKRTPKIDEWTVSAGA